MILSFTRKILYHPVVARACYDFVISFALVSSISSLFIWYHQLFTNFFLLLLFPLLFIVCNYFLGMYTTHKLSPVKVKSAMLLLSATISFGIVGFFGGYSLLLIVTTIMVILTTIMPRGFFNFRNTPSRYTVLHSIIRSTDPIVVVGGGGYIGSMLVEKLLQGNHKVRVFDKFIYGKTVFSGMKNKSNLELIQGDISDIYSLTLALQNAQAVVHLAGIVGDPAAAFDEKITRHINIVSTRMLKETVKAFGIPKFIFASSCSVYGMSTGICNENSSLNPASLYAQTKIDAEQELLQDTFDFFHPTILRFATVFGHSRKPRFDLIANLFVAQAYHTGILTVTNKEQWRPFIHVRDVAHAIFLTLQAPQEKISRQIFNIGNENLNHTIYDVACIAKKIVNPQKKVRIITNNREKDKRNYRVTFKKAYATLGFQPNITLEEGMEEIYHEYKKGTYDKEYTDPYYVNLKMIEHIQEEFYTKKYQTTHFSSIA